MENLHPAPSAMTGRRKIYTDAPAITSDNIIKVLQNAMADHGINAGEANYLIRYEAGVQPLQREKNYRPEIDVQCVDNVAAEITNFKESYVWGSDITLVQRGESDHGKVDEVDAVSLLNEQYEIIGGRMMNQELGRFVEICGVCPVYIDINTEWSDENDAYFKKVVLDPRTSFVVYSSYYVDRRPMLGVTFRMDELGTTYFTAFTADTRYEIRNMMQITNGEKKDTWSEMSRSGERNPLGMIPIIEYSRAIDRTGCFERQLSEMDSLNIMVSDFTNDIDQNTQAIFLGVDIEFPKDPVTGEYIKPSNGDWLLVHSNEQGHPKADPLTVDYNYDGILQNIAARRALILEKCFVPQRNNDSGGSTGIAMSDATGWTAAENDAAREQLIIDTVKMQEIKLVLKALSISPDIDRSSPMLQLRAFDIQPKSSRQKTYELTVKANAFATLVSHGIYGKHAIDLINAFPDPNQVWADSKTLIEKYQKNIFEKQTATSGGTGGFGEKASNADRTMSDDSDQIGNSPVIDK